MRGGVGLQNRGKALISLVPAEGIEPPTFGLQNRCSTAELSRRHLEAGRGRHGPGLSTRCAPQYQT